MPGERERLTDLYCEEVITGKGKLLVPNALKDRKWDKNPGINLGMISYLGFPILWPDAKAFGTICLLDSKENSYSAKIEMLMLRFRDLVEAHLALLHKDLFDRNDERGSLVGVIASFRDVTDRIGLQIQLGKLKGFGEIIGQDPKMLQIYGQIRDLATNNYPVFISGQTGTGKELVAKAIHTESRRGGGPFVPVNCGALPEGLLERELFGHVKGAFTGAIRDKKGRFELAHKGTLFLDEVADLPKSVQSKLLRVLQEGTFERVGGEKTISVDVRLISATNRNFKAEMKNGNFREDLYYRINVVPIHLPPLKERRSDIPLLLENFLVKAKEEGQDTPGLSKEALDIMKDYLWPGNVRELHGYLRFALVRAKGGLIQVVHLPSELKELAKNRISRGPSRKLDKEIVRTAMTQSGGNKAKAARSLAVGRATLYKFLADFPDLS